MKRDYEQIYKEIKQALKDMVANMEDDKYIVEFLLNNLEEKDDWEANVFNIGMALGSTIGSIELIKTMDEESNFEEFEREFRKVSAVLKKYFY